MARQLYFIPIIQPRSSHCFVIKSEPGDTNDVKWSPRACTEASDVASVLRDLWLDEGDTNHEDMLLAVESELKQKRNDELRLKYSSFPWKAS